MGRDPESVQLVAVSKTVPVERLREAVAAGQRQFGENYLQEAQPKIVALGPDLRWHFIGHLQSKKAKAVVELFHLIHSVDRLRLAQALEAAAARRGKIQDILIQVMMSPEDTKSGAPPAEVPTLLKEIAQMSHLRVRGLMTMPPWLPPEEVRPYFRALRELRDQLRAQGVLPADAVELSMGMTADFEVAVQEGATLIRVGTAIFGARPQGVKPLKPED